MRFQDIVGHSDLKRRLAESVDSSRISHAQLFSGESGAGSLALALAYAQYLNCSNRKDGDSCGECPSCQKMQTLTHADMHFVLPVNLAKSGSVKPISEMFLRQWREIVIQSGGYFDEPSWYEKIEIENKQGLINKAEADEILKKLSFKSIEGGYKIMLIWLPERMRSEAANSLLKILEEPWDKTVFLLVSEDKTKLLSTIISRTQEISVPRIDKDSLVEFITKNYTTDQQSAQEIARLSTGNLLRVKALVKGEGDDSSQEFEYFKQLMRLSYNDKHMELLELAEVLASLGREAQKRFLNNAVRLLRNSYMLNAGMSSIVYLWGEQRDFCTKFAPFIGNHNIEQLTADMELAMAQIGQNGNPRMIFSHFVLDVSKKIIKLK